MSAPIRAVVQVGVEDMSRAVRFYRDGLGANVVGGGPDFSIVKFGPVEVCLEDVGVATPRDVGLALEVEDLERTSAAARSAGGEVLRPDDKPWLAIVTDSEGNRLCVVAPGGCFFHPSAVPEEQATAS